MNDVAEASILVVTAVEAEREAVLRGLRGDARFRVVAAGVGPAFAAAGAAFALAQGDYKLVVSAGIGGGFPGRAGIGGIVVADSIHAADLGAETADGFLGVEALGFGTARFAVDGALAERWTDAIRAAGREATRGPIATVSTATGTAATAEALRARVPGVAAEAMEGAGVAAAAVVAGAAVLEVRAVSNAVGPRDRAAWRIGEALQALEAAFVIFTEVISKR
ncbi:futalosine hydrolase [Paenibacillus sp.]|uniref:futalosine hydrolase n=1 Tax=Paenibacillus sp. TaxID=58172 RepID=UPI002D377CEB|nr:futalosine hydrolase [Paenibacillus sp.]HZG58559.1 futalosine hydrolase [Paenibacillus sp.]